MNKSIFNNKNLSKKEIINEFYKQFNNEIPDSKSIVTNFYFDAIKSKNINNLLALQELNILPQNSNITAYDFIWDVIKLDNYKDFFSLYNDLGIFNEEYINRDLERTNCIISSLIFKNKTDVLNNLLDAGFPHKLSSNSAYVYYMLNNKNEMAAKQLFDKNIEIPFSLMISAFMWSSSNSKNIQKHYNVIEMFLDNMNKEIDNSKFNQLKTMAYLNLLDSQNLNESLLNTFLNKYKPGVYDPFYFEFMNKEMGFSKKIAESELHLHYFLKNDISEFSTNYAKDLSYSIAYHALRKNSNENIYTLLEKSFDFNFKDFIKSDISDSQSLIENSFINYDNDTYKFLIKNGLSIDYTKQQELLDKTFRHFSNMYNYNNGKQIAKAQEEFIIEHIIGDSAFELNKPNINVEISNQYKFFPINFLQMALEIKSKKILNSLKYQDRFDIISSTSEYVFSKMHEYKIKENLNSEDLSMELSEKLNIISKIFKIDIQNIVFNSISDICSYKISKEDFTELLKTEMDRKNLKEVLTSVRKRNSVSFNKGRL
ncbi:TPA: hypothetical protein NV714_001766 [Escherichia coli]|nr:hypothetical protein [Escherichia coli]